MTPNTCVAKIPIAFISTNRAAQAAENVALPRWCGSWTTHMWNGPDAAGQKSVIFHKFCAASLLPEFLFPCPCAGRRPHKKLVDTTVSPSLHISAPFTEMATGNMVTVLTYFLCVGAWLLLSGQGSCFCIKFPRTRSRKHPNIFDSLVDLHCGGWILANDEGRVDVAKAHSARALSGQADT